MASPYRLLAWISTLVIFAPVSPAQSYRVTDLGTFPGGTVSQGQAINDCGDVVGYARFANFNAHGFLWSPRLGLQDIGAILPQTNFSVAQAINSSGVVAGYSTYDYPPLLNEHAVLWIDGRIRDLGTFPGSNISEATGINDPGEVVGFSVPHAFLWSRHEGMRDLGTLPGGGYSQALAINARGEVVGYSDAAHGNWHGFVWTRFKGMQPLPFLSGDNSASANGINDRGQIVGGSGKGFSREFAVLWDRHDGGDGENLDGEDFRVESLGALPGQGWSTAFAINDRGQVVGWSGFRAFLWSRKEGIQDLNNLIPENSGWTLILPTAINARGQITGQGNLNGQSHAFLLTPGFDPPWRCDDRR